VVPDLIAPGLKVIFSGINPGLYSAATGHHFARPGNRFWPALYASGLTPRLLSASEERELLALGFGITNIVERATASATELTQAELVSGARRLASRVKRYRPLVLAVLGVGAYRTAFREPHADLGLQTLTIGTTAVWLLPSPSGLNAHYAPADFARLFRNLREYVRRL
jgi:TDG/mug DNA glycosylase family protein